MPPRKESSVHVVTGIWGEKYDERYVTALRRQVPEILVLGRDIERRIDWPGFFGKLECFAPWLAHLRPFLWIDLDTFVLGDLSPLTELTDELWLLNDFFHPAKGESGVMIVPTDCGAIWAGAAAARGHYYGDGPYLAQYPHKRLQSAVPGIKSYKADHLHEGPKGARIVCFHGQPKPADCKGWAREFFDARAT
jgi:hypothetical protein